MQLTLAKKYHLPLFLHSRAAHADFVRILKEEGFGIDGGRGVGGNGGVVHSFTGSPEEALEYVSLSCIASLRLGFIDSRWIWDSIFRKICFIARDDCR